MAFVELSAQRASSTPSGSAASKSAAFPGDVTAGNLIVVGGSWETSADYRPNLTVAGGGGPGATDWVTLVMNLSAAATQQYTFLSVAYVRTSGPCTVTDTLRGAGGSSISAYGNFSITEFTGVGGVVGFSQSVGSSTSPTSNALEVLTGDLMLGALTWRVNQPCTVPSGWTQIGAQQLYGADAPHSFGFKIASGAGTETPVWSLAGSGDWVVNTAIVRLSGGGSPTTGGGAGTLAGASIVGSRGVGVF